MNSVELYNNIFCEDYKSADPYHNYEISLKEYLKRQNKLEFIYIINNLITTNNLDTILYVIKSNNECWIYIDDNIYKYVNMDTIIKYIITKYNIKNFSFFGPVKYIDYNIFIFPYINYDDINIEYTGLNKLVKVDNISYYDYLLVRKIKQCLRLHDN